MTDYICREAAKDAALENIINSVCEEQGMYGFLCNLVDKVFDALPAADVRPVVKNSFRAFPGCTYSRFPVVVCKSCGYLVPDGAFCYNCGAEMEDGE